MTMPFFHYVKDSGAARQTEEMILQRQAMAASVADILSRIREVVLQRDPTPQMAHCPLISQLNTEMTELGPSPGRSQGQLIAVIATEFMESGGMLTCGEVLERYAEHFDQRNAGKRTIDTLVFYMMQFLTTMLELDDRAVTRFERLPCYDRVLHFATKQLQYSTNSESLYRGFTLLATLTKGSRSCMHLIENRKFLQVLNRQMANECCTPGGDFEDQNASCMRLQRVADGFRCMALICIKARDVLSRFCNCTCPWCVNLADEPCNYECMECLPKVDFTAEEPSEQTAGQALEAMSILAEAARYSVGFMLPESKRSTIMLEIATSAATCAACYMHLRLTASSGSWRNEGTVGRQKMHQLADDMYGEVEEQEDDDVRVCLKSMASYKRQADESRHNTLTDASYWAQLVLFLSGTPPPKSAVVVVGSEPSKRSRSLTMGYVDRKIRQTCRSCGKADEGNGMRLKQCGGCGNVRYCSSGCQKADWPNHKKTCTKTELKKSAEEA